jgi:hypothetical protein
MTWLGLIELGGDGSEGSAGAFRLTRAGAALLDLADPPKRSAPSRARLEPGFRVSIPARRRYERFQLARVADWLATGKSFTYRLTPASLKRAGRQGITIPRVLEFLQEITEAPLPRSVEEALSRWNARGTEARLERAIVLTLSDEELMDQVVSAPRLVDLIEERVGPTAALVHRQDWPRVVARLAEMGLLPEIVGLSE